MKKLGFLFAGDARAALCSSRRFERKALVARALAKTFTPVHQNIENVYFDIACVYESRTNVRPQRVAFEFMSDFNECKYRETV